MLMSHNISFTTLACVIRLDSSYLPAGDVLAIYISFWPTSYVLTTSIERW